MNCILGNVEANGYINNPVVDPITLLWSAL